MIIEKNAISYYKLMYFINNLYFHNFNCINFVNYLVNNFNLKLY